MAFSNFCNYLKDSVSETLNKLDKDALNKVGYNSKKQKKVGRNMKEFDQDEWEIVDDNDDDVKVPIKGKFQETKTKSPDSSKKINLTNVDEDSDEFYICGDEDEVKNYSLSKRPDLKKRSYKIIEDLGDSVRVIEDLDDSSSSEESEDFVELGVPIDYDLNKKADDKQLASIIENFEDVGIDNAQLPLTWESFYVHNK